MRGVRVVDVEEQYTSLLHAPLSLSHHVSSLTVVVLLYIAVLKVQSLASHVHSLTAIIVVQEVPSTSLVQLPLSLPFNATSQTVTLMDLVVEEPCMLVAHSHSLLVLSMSVVQEAEEVLSTYQVPSLPLSSFIATSLTALHLLVVVSTMILPLNLHFLSS